jgi:HPt (histidine-containing phosphotransfer) domain-containing protein
MCAASGHALEAKTLEDRIDALALGDPTVAHNVTSALIDTNCATLHYMIAARENGEWDELARAAHRLAGSLSMLQCTREIELASRLERAALAHDARAVAALLPAVAKAVACLDEKLSALLA